MKYKILPIYMIFVAMGMIDGVGPMVGLARESFAISITMATLLPLLGYIMYAVISVPVGLLQDRKGKKFALNIGLTVMLLGFAIPTFSGMYGRMIVNPDSMMQFYKIMMAVLLLGIGAATLQVAGHPFIRDVSEEGFYSKNLSLALFFLSIGSSMGFLMPPLMSHAFNLDWSVLFPIFSGIALISLVWLNSVKIQERSDIKDHQASLGTIVRLFRNGYVVAMVFGLFIYCGIEIGMSSHVPILLSDKYLIPIERYGLLISWSLLYLPIMLGRLTGSIVMSWIAPKKLFLVVTLLSLAGVLLIFMNVLTLALIGVFLVGLGFGNIFPLIFSITIDRMPQYTNELSGLMVTTIAGGAIIPSLMGVVADNFSIVPAFIVPLACILYLILLAIINLKGK